MKFLFLTVIQFILISLIQRSYAQGHKLSGIVLDSSNMPVESAQIVLKNDANEVKTATITDSKGYFEIVTEVEKGNLTISLLSSILYSKNFVIKEDTSFGVIYVKTVKTLNEVSVIAKKNYVERKIDRLVYNVENTISAKGGTVVDLLKTTPLIKLDNNGISIIGKSGLSMMINNRPVKLDGEDLLNYLKSLTSDEVSKIEVITTPPSKFDAQGNSGIVNIVLKKNENIGFNGSISSSFTQTTYPGYSNSATVNWANQKTSISVKLRQFNRQQKISENVNLIGDTSILSHTLRKDGNIGIGGNFTINYNLSKNSNIGLVYDISKTKNSIGTANTTSYLFDGTLDSILNTPARQADRNTAQTLSAYYDLKLGGNGKNLNVEFDYFNNQPFRENNFSTFVNSSLTPFVVKNTSDLSYNVYSGQANLDLPLSFVKPSFGVKYTVLNNNSNINYYSLENDEYVNDPSKSNQFDYKEQNRAVYLNLVKEFSKTFSAQAGLRYEYSSIEGISTSDHLQPTFQYANLFPTVYIEYKPNIDNSISFNYSKRINRPGFNALNPFRWYANPYIYSSGNPFLRPSYNHNLELNYSLYNNLNLSAFYQKTVNGFGGVTEITNGLKITSFENYYNSVSSGLSANYTWTPYTWWENSLNAVVYRSSSKSIIDNIVPVNGFSANISSNNSFKLDSRGSSYVSVNYFQNFPSRELNVYSKAISSLTVGFRQLLFDKKLTVNILLQDIYKGTVTRSQLQYATFKQIAENYYDNRRLAVSLTYNFGRSGIKGPNKQLKFSDKSRAD